MASLPLSHLSDIDIEFPLKDGGGVKVTIYRMAPFVCIAIAAFILMVVASRIQKIYRIAEEKQDLGHFFRMLVTGLWSTQYVMVDANLPLLDDATLASLPCAKSPTISNLQSGGIATKLMIPRNNLQEARLKIYQTGGEELGQYDIKRLPNLDEPQVTALMRAIWPEWELPTPPWSYLIT